MYVVYCQNKPKSEHIVSEYIDTYFEVSTTRYFFSMTCHFFAALYEVREQIRHWCNHHWYPVILTTLCIVTHPDQMDVAIHF